MTSWKSLEIVPREVIAFIDKRKCPICKSKLGNDGDDNCSSLDTGNDYVVWTNCAKEPHYCLNLAWEDPKEIYITDEEIEFEYNDKQFQINKWYTDLGTKTDIKIFGLDELGHVNDDYAKEISFNEDHFDFDKFNAPKFGELIKTLLIFR